MSPTSGQMGQSCVLKPTGGHGLPLRSFTSFQMLSLPGRCPTGACPPTLNCRFFFPGPGVPNFVRHYPVGGLWKPKGPCCLPSNAPVKVSDLPLQLARVVPKLLDYYLMIIHITCSMFPYSKTIFYPLKITTLRFFLPPCFLPNKQQKTPSKRTKT